MRIHSHLRPGRRLAWALLLAGGVTLALAADEDSSYFDPLPRSGFAVQQPAPSTGTRGWLGVTVSSARGGEGPIRSRGARVDEVSEGGPGDKAGLCRGDLIVGMEDKPVRDADDLASLVAMARPGSVASVEVLRGRKRLELPVKVGRRAETPEYPPLPEDDVDAVRLGMGVAKADAALRRRFGLDREDLGALVVVDLEDKGAAEEAGIRPGDLVLEADGEVVASVEALRAAVAKGRKAGKMSLRIRRNGETLRKTVRLDFGDA